MKLLSGVFGGRRRVGKIELLVLGIAVIATVGALFVILSPPSTPADGDVQTGSTQTRFGPLDANDRILLAKVRQAGLWEMPTGQQAVQRAKSARVKEVGQMISDQHMQLDQDVRTTAAKLGVVLPSRPNADQTKWMTELSGLYGAEYDRTFVLRLRAAHGKVFGIIAQVRASTRNSVIRAFATRSMVFVQTHMNLLESTGLVTDDALHTS